MERYQLVFSNEAFRALRNWKGRSGGTILRALDAISEYPGNPPDFTIRSLDGRTISVKQIGTAYVQYFADDIVKELRILNVTRYRP